MGLQNSACRLRSVDRGVPNDLPSASGVLDSSRRRVRAGSNPRHGAERPISDAGELESGRDPHARARPDGVERTEFAGAIEGARATELPGPEASRACPRTDELSLLLPRRLFLVRGLFFRAGFAS